MYRSIAVAVAVLVLNQQIVEISAFTRIVPVRAHLSPKQLLPVQKLRTHRATRLQAVDQFKDAIAVIPSIVQGIRAGDSVSTLIVPLVETIKNFITFRLPIVSLIIKSILKDKLFKSDLVFKGLKLPDEINYDERFENFFSLTGSSQVAVLSYKARSTPIIKGIIGRSKSAVDAFDKIHESYVDFAIKSSKSLTWKRNIDTPAVLPEGYQHFGSNDNVANIPYFFANNPFFTASLRDHPDGGYEIDPYGTNGSTYFSRILAPLDKKVIRVYARLDADMKLMPGTLKLLRDGKPLSDVEAATYTPNRAAATLLLQGTYFAQCVHATTHIFHLIMGVGLEHATERTALQQWANPQLQNLYLKYVEVELLLFSETGALTSDKPSSYYIADREATLEVCKDMLSEWGSFKTAKEYVDKFLFKNIPKGVKSGKASPEFMKHVSLMADYSAELDAAVLADGAKDYAKINKDLAKFMKATGEGISEVDNIKTWSELMAVSGVLHGSTISMTRLFCTSSIVAERNPVKESFDEGDSDILQTSIGTITGTLEDFRVFSSTLPSAVSFNVQRVLSKYDGLSTGIKAEFYYKITENVEEFKKFGWILTDHGPNFVDAKQLTITTYI